MRNWQGRQRNTSRINTCQVAGHLSSLDQYSGSTQHTLHSYPKSPLVSPENDWTGQHIPGTARLQSTGVVAIVAINRACRASLRFFMDQQQRKRLSCRCFQSKTRERSFGLMIVTATFAETFVGQWLSCNMHQTFTLVCCRSIIPYYLCFSCVPFSCVYLCFSPCSVIHCFLWFGVVLVRVWNTWNFKGIFV